MCVCVLSALVVIGINRFNKNPKIATWINIIFILFILVLFVFIQHLPHTYCNAVCIFNQTCVVFKILVYNKNNYVLINMKPSNLKYGSILKKHARHYSKRIHAPMFYILYIYLYICIMHLQYIGTIFYTYTLIFYKWSKIQDLNNCLSN